MKCERTWTLALTWMIVASTAALAGGVVTMIEMSLVLEGKYDTLATQIDNCPNGSCTASGELADELDRLSGELTQLHADIATCGCSNATLDAIVDGLDANDADLHDTVDSW